MPTTDPTQRSLAEMMDEHMGHRLRDLDEIERRIARLTSVYGDALLALDSILARRYEVIDEIEAVERAFRAIGSVPTEPLGIEREWSIGDVVDSARRQRAGRPHAPFVAELPGATVWACTCGKVGRAYGATSDEVEAAKQESMRHERDANAEEAGS